MDMHDSIKKALKELSHLYNRISSWHHLLVVFMDRCKFNVDYSLGTDNLKFRVIILQIRYT